MKAIQMWVSQNAGMNRETYTMAYTLLTLNVNWVTTWKKYSKNTML